MRVVMGFAFLFPIINLTNENPPLKTRACP